MFSQGNDDYHHQHYNADDVDGHTDHDDDDDDDDFLGCWYSLGQVDLP